MSAGPASPPPPSDHRNTAGRPEALHLRGRRRHSGVVGRPGAVSGRKDRNGPTTTEGRRRGAGWHAPVWRRCAAGSRSPATESAVVRVRCGRASGRGDGRSPRRRRSTGAGRPARTWVRAGRWGGQGSGTSTDKDPYLIPGWRRPCPSARRSRPVPRPRRHAGTRPSRRRTWPGRSGGHRCCANRWGGSRSPGRWCSR